MNTVLALDMGASGGRAIVGTYDGNVITLEETHRFENIPVTLDTGLCWDIDALMREIKTGIKKSCDVARIESVGIDTWGVDFGLIGFDGALLENPAHYRNERTDGMLEEAFKLMPSSDIYARTGIQIMQINTLYQLLYLKKQRPELLDKTDKLLFMPDLFAYLLTGVKKAEYTIASTSQMLNPFTRDWDHELLEKFGPTYGVGIPFPSAVAIPDSYESYTQEELRQAIEEAKQQLKLLGEQWRKRVARGR